MLLFHVVPIMNEHLAWRVYSIDEHNCNTNVVTRVIYTITCNFATGMSRNKLDHKSELSNQISLF